MASFQRNFDKYRRQMIRRGKNDLSVSQEDEYVAFLDIRRKITFDALIGLLGRATVLLGVAVLIVWLGFFVQQAMEQENVSPEMTKYILPVVSILVAVYVIVVVPLLIIRKYRTQTNFCSTCGKPLRIVGLFGATIYYCDPCRLRLVVESLDFGSPD